MLGLSSKERLTPLDASFLEVESPTAHMHVGWVVLIRPSADRDRPTFARIRNHVESRLWRAPRYRQKLANVPLGVNDPVWIDDPDFDIRNHVLQSRTRRLDALVEHTYSRQLDRNYPLWEMWISDRLEDGRIALAGKVHHCMVDGIAAVELAMLLLDFAPEPPADDGEREPWLPSPPPSDLALLAEGVRDRMAEELSLMRVPAQIATSPRLLFSFADRARKATLSFVHSAAPAADSMLNESISSQRRLGRLRRPLDDLREIKRRHDATINDVVLAVSSGALRRFSERAGERPRKLKTMVPVNVRDGDASELGNAVSLVFIDLPCDEPDPARRLRGVQLAMSQRKLAGEPLGARTLLDSMRYLPHPVQHAFDHRVASPATFNLVVSNVPGPRQPMYMLGCPMEEAYPVVPLADRHALSIGFTTVAEDGFFGVHSDRRLVPDPGLIARDIGEEIDALLGR
ncbi:MAG: wax ester/triacylglycerol synthase family O-acyltransferase [Solirubrobacterales bacterium]